MSALTPKADIGWRQSNVRFVPASLRTGSGHTRSPGLPYPGTDGQSYFRQPSCAIVTAAAAIAPTAAALINLESIFHPAQNGCAVKT
jgi:hypothetical protein